MKQIFHAFICLAMVTNVSGQTPRLSGTVIDPGGHPLPAITVTLTDLAIQTKTDKEGHFMFTGLKTGAYKIKVSTDSLDHQMISVPVLINDTNIIIIYRQRNYRLLEEVIVEHNQQNIRQREDAMNVDIVTSSFLHRNLGGSLMKSLERIPGIKTIGIGSGQSKPLIRGLGFNRVVVLDKGVKHEGQQWGSDHGLEIDQFAAGEVHLIKGAASFMYGSDAIAGAVDVIPPKLPAHNLIGGSVEMLAKTNNNLYGTSVNVYGRKSNWFFDSRITYLDYADYRVPTDRVSVYNYEVALSENRLRNTAGRESGLHFTTGYTTDGFKSTIYLSNTFSNSGFFANAHGLEPRNVDVSLHDRSPRDMLMPRQEVNHLKIISRNQVKFAGQSVELDLGYQHNFRQEFSQYVNHGYMPAIYPDTMKIPADLEREFEKHTYSAAIRDRFTVGKHEVSIGANLEHQNNNINGWSFLVPSFKQLSGGAFVYDRYRLSDKVIFHGAVRYDYTKLQVAGYTDWFPSASSEDPASMQKLVRAEFLHRNFKSLVWSVGVNINSDVFTFKFNAGKSFRVPIAKELSANGVNYHYFSYERGDPELNPEQSYQADASFGWDNDRSSVTFSPFYNYFPNYIYLNPTSTHDYFYGAGNQVFQYEQSRVVRYGGEVQIKHRLNDQLSTELVGEYLHSQQVSGNKSGYTLPFSPPASVLINVTWSNEEIGIFKQVYISADYRLTARQHQIVPPEKKTPGYQLFNLQAGAQVQIFPQAFTWRIQVQNLFNKSYLNHTSFYRLIELPEAGRNIVLSLRIPLLIKRYE